MKFSCNICKKRSKKSAEIDHCAIARETLAGLLIRFANLRCTLLQCQNVYEVTSEFLWIIINNEFLEVAGLKPTTYKNSSAKIRRLHCNSVLGQYRVFITGFPGDEKLHRENPVFITGMGLQWTACFPTNVKMCRNYVSKKIYISSKIRLQIAFGPKVCIALKNSLRGAKKKSINVQVKGNLPHKWV